MFTKENFSASQLQGANAPAGLAFQRHTGSVGRARMKSHNLGESPTGFRSRGPSAERQVRKLARAEQKRIRAALAFAHAMQVWDARGRTGSRPTIR